MIQDQHLLSCDQDFFSNPESLQQLRDNLNTLLHHQQNSFSSGIDSLHQISVAFQNQNLDQACLKVLKSCTEELEQQIRYKSSNLWTLINLSTKMIDFMLQQRYKTKSMIQEYQYQIEQLRNNIDYLTNTKNVIQNDVDLFREQLQAARSQLEDIIDQKQTHEQQALPNQFPHSQTPSQMEKDRKILVLEEELQNIKEQLKLYKFSNCSRKSLQTLFKGNNLLRYKSQNNMTSNLKYKFTSKISQKQEQSQPVQEGALEQQEQYEIHEFPLMSYNTHEQYKNKVNKGIIQLENTLHYLPARNQNQQSSSYTPCPSQNEQKISRTADVSQPFIFNQESVNPQTQNRVCSDFCTRTDQFPQINNVKQVEIKQTNEQILVNQEETRWILKNTSLTIIHLKDQKLSCKQDQQKQNIHPVQIEQEDKPRLTSSDSSNRVQMYHYLSSEWSAKSFEDNICNPVDLIQSNHAIYLTGEESLSESSIKAPIDISLNKNTEQTKYTQNSINAFSTQQYLSIIKANKQATRKQSHHVEQQAKKNKKVNLQQVQKDTKQKQSQHKQIPQKVQPSFLDAVFKFVVGNRVRKHCKK